MIRACASFSFLSILLVSFASPHVAWAQQMTVFRHAFAFRADLGGLDGADEMCQSEAEAFGMSGTFIPWLSTTTVDAVDRLTPGSGPFLLPSGTKVADDIADLTDGTLDSPIEENAGGVFVVPVDVHTSTLTDGSYSGAGDCDGWTSESTLSGQRVGNSGETDFRWTDEASSNCAAFASLYCFEILEPVAAPATNGYGVLALAFALAAAAYALRRRVLTLPR